MNSKQAFLWFYITITLQSWQCLYRVDPPAVENEARWNRAVIMSLFAMTLGTAWFLYVSGKGAFDTEHHQGGRGTVYQRCWGSRSTRYVQFHSLPFQAVVNNVPVWATGILIPIYPICKTGPYCFLQTTGILKDQHGNQSLTQNSRTRTIRRSPNANLCLKQIRLKKFFGDLI